MGGLAGRKNRLESGEGRKETPKYQFHIQKEIWDSEEEKENSTRVRIQGRKKGGGKKWAEGGGQSVKEARVTLGKGALRHTFATFQEAGEKSMDEPLDN